MEGAVYERVKFCVFDGEADGNDGVFSCEKKLKDIRNLRLQGTWTVGIEVDNIWYTMWFAYSSLDKR